jgi:hypothetical protein
LPESYSVLFVEQKRQHGCVSSFDRGRKFAASISLKDPKKLGRFREPESTNSELTPRLTNPE